MPSPSQNPRGSRVYRREAAEEPDRITCRICGRPREVLAKSAHRYSTCGSPECVTARRVAGGSKSKGRGTDNPRYTSGQWVQTEKACEICGRTFNGPARRRFCSLVCAAENKARTQSGQTFSEERKARMNR